MSLLGLEKAETDYMTIHYPLTNQIKKIIKCACRLQCVPEY